MESQSFTQVIVPLKKNLSSLVKDTDLLLCECNFYQQQNGKSAGHMNSIDAGQFAERAGVKQLILTHLPHYGELSKLISEASTEYTGIIKLADEFQTISL